MDDGWLEPHIEGKPMPS